jgi:hypothetical protein
MPLACSCSYLRLVAVICASCLPLLHVVAIELPPVLVYAPPAPASATSIILPLPVGGAHALVLVPTARHYVVLACC